MASYPPMRKALWAGGQTLSFFKTSIDIFSTHDGFIS
jgi:hypothetical protein